MHYKKISGGRSFSKNWKNRGAGCRKAWRNGLQIKHVAFCDSPHSEAVMKLTMPLIQKLLIPWIIPKKEFTKYGISSKNIITYKAIDAAFIISQKKRAEFKTVPEISKKGRKNILFRTYESSASYAKKRVNIVKIIEKISEIKDVNVIVLGRYSEEINQLKKNLDSGIIILKESVDSKEILAMTDIFVGSLLSFLSLLSFGVFYSSSTMTAESALRGIPTISYNAIPSIIEEYLVKKKLVVRVDNINKLDELILEILNKKSDIIKNRALKEFKSMESPLKKLESVLSALDE